MVNDWYGRYNLERKPWSNGIPAGSSSIILRDLTAMTWRYKQNYRMFLVSGLQELP
jgi:hypothetical protein